MNQALETSETTAGGIYTFSHIRDGKIIDQWEEHNIVVNEGLNYVLDAALSGGTPITAWYVGIFKNNYTPVATNIMATFPGSGVANEADAELTNTTRPAWVEAGPATQVITNSASPAVITFASPVSIYGAFLSSSSVQSGTSGTLLAAAKFASVRAMLAADQLSIVYTLTIASA
jgi:hypothetical protein